MPILLYGLIVPAFSFFLQTWPRFRKRYFGVDTWKWLLFADYVRRHKRLPQESSKKYIVNAVFGYPPVIILLLSLFPKKFLEKYQFIFSPAFDFFHNFIIFLASYYLTNNISVSIIAQVIAMCTLIIVIEGSNLNTRILSSLIFTLSFFPLLVYSYTGQYLFLLLASFWLFVLIYTHRFATQAYIVSIIGLTLYERSLFYIIFFLAIYVLAAIIGGDFYKRMLKEHLSSLAYWIKNIDLRFAHQFRGVPKRINDPDFIQRMYLLSTKNPFFYVLGNNLWIGFFVPIWIVQYFHIIPLSLLLPNAIAVKFTVWIGVLAIWSLAVLGIKQLRFLGEGHRYLEYVTFPTAILLSQYIFSFYQAYGIIILLGFAATAVFLLCSIIFLQHKTIILDKIRSIEKANWEIIHYLNTNGGKKLNLAVFPIQLGDSMMYFFKGSVLTTDTYQKLQELSDIFPVVKTPMSKIIKKFNIDYIYFNKRYVTVKEIGLQKYNIVKDTNDFVLMKV